MNKRILKELEHRLTIISGQLSLVHVENDDSTFLTLAQAEVVGLIHGLRNIIDHMPNEPMTIGELEQAQFDRAKEVGIKPNGDVVNERI